MWGDDNQKYTMETSAGMANQFAKPATIRQRLDMAVEDSKRQYEKALRAKEIFDKNPELEELINLMNTMRY